MAKIDDQPTKQVDMVDRLPDDTLVALGKLTVAYGAVDYIMRMYMKALIGSGYHPGIEAGAKAFRFCELKNLIVKQLELRVDDADEKKAVSNMLDEAVDLAKERADFVHSFYAHDPAEDRYERRRIETEKKKFLRIKTEAVDAEPINDLAKRLFALAQCLEDYRMNTLPTFLRSTEEG